MIEIKIAKSASIYLENLREKERTRLVEKIKQNATDPSSLAGNVKKLQGRDGYRLRVGDFCILFDKNGNILHVTNIGLRGVIYDKHR